MKGSALLSCIAIVLSGVAIFMAATAPKPLSPADFDAAVDAAIAKRERRFVERHVPAFQAMFAEVVDEENPEEWEPETFDELIAPLVRIISVMGEE